MAVSILHRVTGVGLALIGGFVFVWWLLAAASGPGAYAVFIDWATWKWALIVPIGLTWAFLQHLFSGLRHFVMDVGAGYELKTNRLWAIMTMVGSVALTIALWVWIIVLRSA